MARLRLQVQGVVQGVGFRPFVFRLATGLGLGGWVQNRPEGVRIEVQGTADSLEIFARSLIRDLGYKTAEQRAGLKLTGGKLIDDLRVIDVYEEVIQAEKKLCDRRGNWAQPFATPPDANIFVVAQFLRYAEAIDIVKRQPLSALQSYAKGGTKP